MMGHDKEGRPFLHKSGKKITSRHLFPPPDLPLVSHNISGENAKPYHFYRFTWTHFPYRIEELGGVPLII